MRLDKFLKVTRVIKRRTIANEVADKGRVKVNGKTVKPSYEVKIGDVVEIAFGDSVSKFEITYIPTVMKRTCQNVLKYYKMNLKIKGETNEKCKREVIRKRFWSVFV